MNKVRIRTMKEDATPNHTDDDKNLEEEFKLWLPDNGVSSDVRRTYANDLNAIGGTGNKRNRYYNLVQELTGKKPLVPVFSIDAPDQLRKHYDIIFLIKEWDGKSTEKLGEIKAKCQRTVSKEDIKEKWKQIKQRKIPGTNKKTSNGTLNAAIGKYEDFLKWRKKQSPGSPPATTASPNLHSELKDKDGNPLSRNLIYFGAPGTGKSHQLKKEVEAERRPDGSHVKEGENGNAIDFERVTFYPTYSYAQFVGCYKPVMVPSSKKMKGKDTEEGEIAYKFVPGPFLRILVKALKSFAPPQNASREQLKNWVCATPDLSGNTHRNDFNFVIDDYRKLLETHPQDDYCLVIEEINRANAAAVFGDVFQLLDRDSKSGKSEYDIAASEDVKHFLQEEFKDYSPSKEDDPAESQKRNPLTFLKVAFKKDAKGETSKEWESCRLRIPSNMYIWATMNSADQGVFPMDTAFKRRWEFAYVGIDEGVTDKLETWTIEGTSGRGGQKYNWNKVRQFVNGLLSLHGVNEDKLMGAHFVQAPDGVVSAKAFESKVLMYLWEDAGRMCRKDLFGDIATYSQLLQAWNGKDKSKGKGIKVFDKDKKREDLEPELKEWYKDMTEAPSAD